MVVLEGRRLGDADACAVVMASGPGLQAGQEVLYPYRPRPSRGSSSEAGLQYGLDLLFAYGFFPRAGAP